MNSISYGWMNFEEWDQVRSFLFSNQSIQRHRAVDRVKKNKK